MKISFHVPPLLSSLLTISTQFDSQLHIPFPDPQESPSSTQALPHVLITSHISFHALGLSFYLHDPTSSSPGNLQPLQ